STRDSSAYGAVRAPGSQGWGSPSGVQTTKSYQVPPGESSARSTPKISAAIAVSYSIAVSCMARARRGMSETVRTMSFGTLVVQRRGDQDRAMQTPQAVMVYGAGGHTGGFVVDELVRRGLA